MYSGEARKEGAVNDYLLGEMAKIRIDELRAEASRVHAAREPRRSHGWRNYLGMLAVSGAPRGEGGGSPRETIEEAFCA
jgi:hypothetical protein